MIVSFRTFLGMMPRLPDYRLPEAGAALARDANLARGDLRPLAGTLSLFNMNAVPRSIFTVDGISFGTWDYEVDAVRGPVLEDSHNRFYYTAGSPLGVAEPGSYVGPDGRGMFLAFTDGLSLSGGAPQTRYRVGVPTMPNPVLTVFPRTPEQTGVTLTATFFYEAAGVKYQETPLIGAPPTVLTTITEGRKYAFRPPAKAVVGSEEGEEEAGGPPSGPTLETISVHQYSRRREDANTPGGFAEDWVAVTPGNATIAGPDAFTLNGTSYTNVYRIIDSQGSSHECATLYSMIRFANVYDSGSTTGGGETAPNASQTPEGYTPDGAIPIVHLIGRLDGNVIFDVYSAGSSFNNETPIPRVTLELESGNTGRMLMSVDYSGTNSKFEEARSYIVTAINQFGEEGPPSEPRIVTVNIFEKVRIVVNSPSVTPPSGPRPYAPIAKIRVYRTAITSTVETDYFPVFDYPAGGPGNPVDVTDIVKSYDLGPDPCPSWEWEPPPVDITGLTYIGNGMLAGITKDMEVAISEPFRPHAWPRTYFQSFPSMPRRIMPHGNAVIVTTTGYPYMLVGATPAGMTQQRLAAAQAAVNKRAHADLGSVIAYASNDGIVIVRGGQASLDQSFALWGRDRWRELYGSVLSRMQFAVHDGMLLVFWEPGGELTSQRGFMLRLDEGGGVLVDVTTTGAINTVPVAPGYFVSAFMLPQTDSLYIGMRGPGILHGIGRFANKAEYTFGYSYFTRTVSLPKPYNFGACQVNVDYGYPVNVTVIADNLSVDSFVASGTAGVTTRLLPTNVCAREWSLRFVGIGTVREAHLASTRLELQKV